jgi:Tfp pilus assembly protein PilF
VNARKSSADLLAEADGLLLRHALRDAVDAYRALLRAGPQVWPAYAHMGLALQLDGQPEQARTAFRTAMALAPDALDPTVDLADSLLVSGDLSAGQMIAARAIGIDSGSVRAWFSLGNAAAAASSNVRAWRCYRRALAMVPADMPIVKNLVALSRRSGTGEAAVVWVRRHLCVEPGEIESLEALFQLTNDARALRRCLCFVPSRAAMLVNAGTVAPPAADSRWYRRALSVSPWQVAAAINLAGCLRRDGDVAGSIALYRQALLMMPEHAEGHYNLGLALLQNGEWREGWSEYAWRWKIPAFRREAGWGRAGDATIDWDGRRLAEGTVLVLPEQGLGDCLQFSRFVPLAAQRSHRLHLLCDPSLTRVFRGLGRDIDIRSFDAPLPKTDVRTTFVDLARIFGAMPERVPGTVPYLTATLRRDSSILRADRAGERKLRVALTWYGNLGSRSGSARALPPDCVMALTATPACRFFSFQVGTAPPLAPPPDVVDLGRFHTDFADTAAELGLVDLLITTDTSIVHLAGALGCPTWLLLNDAPDWRWLIDRRDTPWYPTVRLFRQRPKEGWWPVIDRVRKELAAYAG